MKSLNLCLACCLLLAGCSKNIQNPEAVKSAILEHLAAQKTDLNMGAMDLDVTAATYRENDASVTVGYRPKGSADIAMSMSYQLKRDGNKWVVDKKEILGDPGSAPHGAQPTGELPPGHPPLPPAAK